MYKQAEDAPKPQFVVVVIYSEYEESSFFFIEEARAREFAKEKAAQSETHLGRLLAVEERAL